MKIKTITLATILSTSFFVQAVIAAPPVWVQDVNVLNFPEDQNVTITDSETVLDVIIQNTVPVPVDEIESSSDWITQEHRGMLNACPSCSFSGASVSFSNPTFGTPVPEGKRLLIKTVTISHGSDGTLPANAAIQFSGGTRFFVGGMHFTPGFTGTEAMATITNLNVVSGGFSAVVGWIDPTNRPSGDVQVKVYVSGRMIDAPEF